MRVLISLTVLLILADLFLLQAGPEFFTKISTASGFSEVQTWVESPGQVDKPLAVGRTAIKTQNSLVNRTNSQLFYVEADYAFGLVRLSTNQTDHRLLINWYDTGGQSLGYWEQPWPQDGPFPALRVDPVSARLIAVDLFNHIRIIDRNSKIINEFPILKDYSYHSENHACLDFNGGYLAVAVTATLPVKNELPMYHTSIRVYSLQGEEHLHHDLPGWRIRALNSSADGKMLAVSIFKQEDETGTYQFRSLIFSPDGKIVSDHPFRFRQAYFNQNRHRVFFRDKQAGYLLDLSSNSLVAEVKTKDKDGLIISAVFLPPSDNLVVQQGKSSPIDLAGRKGWIYQQIRLTTINAEGREIHDLSIDDISVDRPVLRYNEGTKQIFLGHRKGWLRYQLNN